MFPLRDSPHSCPNKKGEALSTGPCFMWPVASNALRWAASTPPEISWSTSPGQPAAFPPSPLAPPGFYQTQSGTILLGIRDMFSIFPFSCLSASEKPKKKMFYCCHTLQLFFITLISPFSILKCSLKKKPWVFPEMTETKRKKEHRDTEKGYKQNNKPRSCL